MLPADLDFAVISLSLAALITSIFIFIVAFRKSKSVSDFFFILFSISIYFDQLLKRNIFTIPKFNTINIHPGVLPDLRGPFPTFGAVYNRVEKFGVTSHIIDDKFDTGDIIICEKVQILNKRSILGIDYYIFKKVIDVVDKSVYLFEKGKVSNVKYKQKMESYFSFPSYNHALYIRRGLKIKLYTFNDFLRYFR